MGDPRKARKKFASPKKPWQKERLDAEKELVKEYGVVNKTEIYKMQSALRKFALRAKQLLSSSSPQAEQERKALLSKLSSLSIIGENAQLDDVLALQLKNIMERRLQTLLLRKGLANTIKQARQFIVHQHVMVGNKIMTSPSYVVSKEEEDKIVFVEKSALAKPDHPERPEGIAKLKESLKKAKAVVEQPAEEAEAPKEQPPAEIKEEPKQEVKEEPAPEKPQEQSQPEVPKKEEAAKQ